MENVFDKNYIISTRSLKCPMCGKNQSVEDILSNSTVSWPEQDWIYFKCKLCYEGSHVEIITDNIKTGVLDGAPGPCFFVCSDVFIDSLDVMKAEDYIECKYNGEKYIFEKKK